jgi:hypothetical protein
MLTTELFREHGRLVCFEHE